MSNPWVGDLNAQQAAERARAYSQRFDRLAAHGNNVHGEADLVAAMLPEDGGLVLDAGCGTGRVAARLAEQGYRTVGVDLDAGMLSQAYARHPELTWVQSDLADLHLGGIDPRSAVDNPGLPAPGTLDLGSASGTHPDNAQTAKQTLISSEPDGAVAARGQVTGLTATVPGSSAAVTTGPLTTGAVGVEAFAVVVAAGNVMPLLTPGTETAVIAVLAGLLRPGGLLIAGFGLDNAHLPPSAPSQARFRSLADYDADCSAAGLSWQDRWATWDRAPFANDGYAVSVHVRT
jgi:SAM-dependent methyltransferase